MQGVRRRVQGEGCGVHGAGCMVNGVGCWVYGVIGTGGVRVDGQVLLLPQRFHGARAVVRHLRAGNNLAWKH